MYAGLDFGTSNCSIGVWKEGSPELIPLEKESNQLPSALYTKRKNIEIEKISSDKLERRVAQAKRRQSMEAQKAKADGAAYKTLTDAELENIVRGAMRREIAQRAQTEYEQQSIRGALYANTDTVFGDEAIRQHIQDPHNGYFIKSPKSYLGADIQQSHIEVFSEVITRLLSHIKVAAERQNKSEVSDIVLGRPVNFHGTRGEKGNRQAIRILERAAIAAGFKNIEFLMEPVAAAIDYERQLDKDLTALILDMGGGTTDCSMIRLGPTYSKTAKRSSSVLGYAGDRTGGTDIDIKLALKNIMPHFGMNTLLTSGRPIPNTLFWDAVAVNDVNAKESFLSDTTHREILSFLSSATEKEKFKRLLNLQETRNVVRLNRSAELAKIHLSERDVVHLPLRYIDTDLVVDISRQNLREAIDREFKKFGDLMREVESQAGVKPDVIYVTGGTAKSPVIKEWIREQYGDTEIVVGDAFGSVTAGLTTWAHELYK